MKSTQIKFILVFIFISNHLIKNLKFLKNLSSMSYIHSLFFVDHSFMVDRHISPEIPKAETLNSFSPQQHHLSFRTCLSLPWKEPRFKEHVESGLFLKSPPDPYQTNQPGTKKPHSGGNGDWGNFNAHVLPQPMAVRLKRRSE